MNLLENIVTEMSPTEFEMHCLELLNSLKNDFSKCDIKHNQIYKADDGNYQLDGVIEFEQFGVKYKTIVECKKYKSSIKRSQIQVLHDTIRNVGAHKGILVSTSSYQKGAVDYARKHGIALLQIVDGFITTIQNSLYPPKIQKLDVPKYVFALYDLDLGCVSGFIKKEKLKSVINYLDSLE